MRISARAGLAVTCICLVIGTSAVCLGCEQSTGESPPEERTESAARGSATTGVGPTDESAAAPTTTAAPAPAEFPRVFVDLAQALAPVPVYGWTKLPDGAELAGQWWPIMDCESPEEYEGPRRANPWVGQDPSEPEAQLLMQVADGWLVVLENFRGDLGDVAGESAGAVNGRPATLYKVDGGTLVQWSDTGRWYGVFGRNLAADFVVAAGLSMEIVPTRLE